MEKKMKQKKTYAERLELYNKRMSHFKTKFTPEQLDEFGRGENLRLIPQLLRLWLVLNMNRFIEIDEMMNTYAHFENDKNKTTWCPILQIIKRELCHDKVNAKKEIERTISDLANNKFHFYHLSPMEQLYTYGVDGYDPARIFTEDIGTVKWNAYQLITVLRQLLSWLKKAPDYQYPAEKAMALGE